MKKMLVLLVCSLVSVFTYADRQDGTSIKDIVEKAYEIVENIEEKDMEVVHLECDILKTKKSVTRTLSKGWTYGVIAFGDDRFLDIDVVIYRKNGNQWVRVAKDDDESAVATVEVTPASDGEYKIEIQAYKFAEGYSGGHYGLIMFHE